MGGFGCKSFLLSLDFCFVGVLLLYKRGKYTYNRKKIFIGADYFDMRISLLFVCLLCVYFVFVFLNTYLI